LRLRNRIPSEKVSIEEKTIFAFPFFVDQPDLLSTVKEVTHLGPRELMLISDLFGHLGPADR
jgi:hypothetical protein